MVRLHVLEGDVVEIGRAAPGLTRLKVLCPGGLRTALCYHPPLPEPEVGDRVVLNTAAVDLGLGTGGADFVMHVVGKEAPRRAGPGHLVKLRYTPWQLPVLAVEEEDSPFHDVLKGAGDVAGMPAVVVALHSQLPPAAAALRQVFGPAKPIVFVMTDDGALPVAVSETVPRLKQAGLLDGVVTTGDSFGGDLEAMTLFSGLLAARHAMGAAAVVVGPGPGIAGTGTPFGTTAIHIGRHADAVGILGGRAFIAPRISFADARPRHRGVSHHTLTALGRIAQRPCTVVVPRLGADRHGAVMEQLERAGVAARHRIVLDGRGDAALQRLRTLGVPLRSMGRDEVDEAPLFLAAAAAGFVAGDGSGERGMPGEKAGKKGGPPA